MILCCGNLFWSHHFYVRKIFRKYQGVKNVSFSENYLLDDLFMCALFPYLDLRKFVRVAIASFSNKTITTDSPFYFFFFWISSSISSPQVKSIFWQYLRFNIESFFNIDNRWGFVMKMNWLWKSHSHLILLICFSVNKFLSSLRMLLMISY